MRRVLLLLLQAVQQFVLVASVALAVGLVWLQSPPGRSWALEQALAMLAEQLPPGLVVRAQGLGAGWPLRLALTEVTLADKDGDFATLRDVRLSWSPLDLRHRIISLQQLSAAEVRLLREPDLPADKAQDAGQASPAPEYRFGLEDLEIGALYLPGLPHSLTVQLAAHGSLTAATIDIREVAVPALGAQANGQVVIQAGKAPQGTLALDVPDLAVAAAAYGKAAQGQLQARLEFAENHYRAEMQLNGLSYEGVQSEQLAVRSTFTIAEHISGQIAASGQLNGQELQLSSTFTQSGDTLSFDGLDLKSALARAQGDVRYNLSSQQAIGQMQVELPDLAKLSPWLGPNLNGQAQASLRFGVVDNTQRVGWQVSTSLQAPYNVQMRGQGEVWQHEQALQARIASLDGQYDGQDLRLLAPVELRYMPGELSLGRTQLAYGKARLEAEGKWQPQALSAQAMFSQLGLPGLDEIGLLSGKVVLTGTAGQPVMNGQIDLQPAGLEQSRLSAQLDYAQGTAQVKAAYTLQNRTLLTAQTRAAYTLNLMQSDVPALLNAPLTGKAVGEVPLDWLARQDIIAIPVQQGRLALDVALSGNLANPLVAGTAHVQDAVYISALSGTELHNLEARLRFNGRQAELTSLTATDGRKGTLTGQGQFASEAYTLSLTAHNFLALRLPEATASVNATLHLSGPALSALALSGNVEVNEAKLRIPARLPVSLVALPVTHRGAVRQPLDSAGQDSAPDFSIALNVAIEARNRVQLEGRGLQTELAGQLQVLGTTTAPDITGGLQVVRGSYDFLGKRLTLSSGSVAFNGGSFTNPALDLLANHSADGITYSVNVAGPARAPDISYESDPALPQDEIISRLLFGSSVTQLSPLQAVQLARALASLAGGGDGFDLTGGLRRGLGLDQLDVVSGQESESGPSGSLEAGKYLTDDIYLSTRQGLTPDSTRVGVEMKLSPSISVQSDTGANSSSNLQLRYQRDY